jgi:osmotically-inducible protein OsmY
VEERLNTLLSGGADNSVNEVIWYFPAPRFPVRQCRLQKNAGQENKEGSMARDDQYWGSARSDYGRYAYDGDLNERGVERRHEWRGGRDSAISHVGKGPRGWRRSDERILEDVCDLMMLDPDLDASEIEARVSNGEVILEGSVESRWAKRLAEDIAFSAPGVRDVQNRLRVSYVVNRYAEQRPEGPYPM